MTESFMLKELTSALMSAGDRPFVALTNALSLIQLFKKEGLVFKEENNVESKETEKTR